ELHRLVLPSSGAICGSPLRARSSGARAPGSWAFLLRHFWGGLISQRQAASGAPKAQILELSHLAFVARAENVVLLGPSGVGKAHIVRLGHIADTRWSTGQPAISQHAAAQAAQCHDR